MEIFLVVLFALAFAYGGYKLTKAVEKGKGREEPKVIYTPPSTETYTAPGAIYPDPVKPIRKPTGTAPASSEAKHSRSSSSRSYDSGSAYYGSTSYGSAGSYDSGSSSSSSSSCDSGSSSSGSCD